MSDFLVFNEGASELVNNGLPATTYFLLSTKSVGSTSPHVATETLAGADLGEITGTSYARLTESEPTASAGVVTFAVKSWSTGSATDWPSAVRSIVLVTGASTSGKAIAAFNLVAGGAARDLSAASTTENVTVTLTLPPG
jgi:hypothetical protein